MKHASDLLKTFTDAAGVGRDGHPVEEKSNGEMLIKLLEQRRFKPKDVPPAIRPIYTLGGCCIATPGNLATITAAIKTGKSAVIGAIAASVMAKDKTLDLLGFSSSNRQEKALLHFDTEQSPDDHWHAVTRMLKRASLSAPPPWFYSYCLTGLGYNRAWECVDEVMRSAAKAHGGIHSSLIDGVADMVTDVNDAHKCNDFVAMLHATAIQYDCPIFSVIHFNPGSEKSRGHLGSQLERKAETNLRLDKTDGVTAIWSDKQRRAPIPRGTGPCFKWDDAAGMHLSTETLGVSKEKQEADRLLMLADEVFGERPSMAYSDLVSTVKTKRKMSERTAERRVQRMSELKVIKKSVAGLWVKTA